MALTANQIKRLNRSSTPAQDVALGTIIATLSGSGTVKAGTTVPVSASLCLINTGLTTIKGFSVIHSGSPTSGIAMVSACIVGSYLNVKSWAFGSASATSLVAATTLDTVAWVAVGES